MAEFLEERLPVDVRMGATYADDYDVEIVTTTGGQEYRALIQPFPRREFSVAYTDDAAALWSAILALYHRAYGRLAGFRVRCLDDYSTNGMTGIPTHADQPLEKLSASLYRLQKAYGAGASPLGIGLPVRTLFKPVSGTVKVAVAGKNFVAPTNYSVDHSTGKITFVSKTLGIAGINKAYPATITTGAHPFGGDDWLHVSGVAGMTEINGLRVRVVGELPGSITVDLDTTGFSTYTSGGTLNTLPQAGESVTGGCEFDIPCRFNSRIDVRHISRWLREAGAVDLIELINP